MIQNRAKMKELKAQAIHDGMTAVMQEVIRKGLSGPDGFFIAQTGLHVAEVTAPWI